MESSPQTKHISLLNFGTVNEVRTFQFLLDKLVSSADKC